MAILEDGDSDGENPNGGGGAIDTQRGDQAKDRDRESSQSVMFGGMQDETLILDGGEANGEDETRVNGGRSDAGDQMMISNGQLGVSGDLPISENVGVNGGRVSLVEEESGWSFQTRHRNCWRSGFDPDFREYF